MLISVNIEIEISEIELRFLRKYYVDNRKFSINSYFLINSLDKNKKEDITNIFSLRDKEILIMDELDNNILTRIGNLVCDQLDRDIKINKILNGS